jgi:hypothetical protein
MATQLMGRKRLDEEEEVEPVPNESPYHLLPRI